MHSKKRLSDLASGLGLEQLIIGNGNDMGYC